jgi:replication factor C small subunit
MSNDFLWVEKYRPHKVEDCILPDSMKETFQAFVDGKEIPNLLLKGSPGVGKTTIAKALCDQLGASFIVINGSDEGRFLDTIRSRVKKFATTVSLTSSANHKVVIIDEADNTTDDVQKSLRAFIEEFHSNCRFIFTCNYPNRIIEAIHSRCTVVNFDYTSVNQQKLQAQFFTRLREILNENEVTFDNKILAGIVMHYYPDWRRTLNEIQRFSATGELSPVALQDISDVTIDQLAGLMKNRKFTEIRKWVVDNSDKSPASLFRKFYDSLSKKMNHASVPELILILAKYQKWAKDVDDQEINTIACLTEIMMSCEFK